MVITLLSLLGVLHYTDREQTDNFQQDDNITGDDDYDDNCKNPSSSNAEQCGKPNGRE